MHRLFGLIWWEDLCDFFYCLPVTVLKLFCKLFFIDTDKIVMKMAEKWTERNTRIITLKNGFKVFEEMKPIPYFYKAYNIQESCFDEETQEDYEHSVSVIDVVLNKIKEGNPELRFCCDFDNNYGKQGLKVMYLSNAKEDDINLMRSRPARFFDYMDKDYLFFIPNDDDEVRRIAEESCDKNAELNYEKGEFLYDENAKSHKFLYRWTHFYGLKEVLFSLFKLLFAYDLREREIMKIYDFYKEHIVLLTLSNGRRILKIYYPSMSYYYYGTYIATKTIERFIKEEKVDFLLIDLELDIVSEDKSLRQRIDFRRITDRERYKVFSISKDYFMIGFDANNDDLVHAVEKGFLSEGETGAQEMEKRMVQQGNTGEAHIA